MNFKSPIPILRSFYENKAREFYIHFLEFNMKSENICYISAGGQWAMGNGHEADIYL